MIGSLFVTGTDTGVGKTLVAAALLHTLRRRGLRAAGMKPVAAGCVTVEGRWHNEDVAALGAAGNVEAPPGETSPYLFHEAIAPHIAAARHGVTIDMDLLVARFRALSARADAVVVEGAGGFLVPLGDRDTFADLATRLALPVVLVVGLRLGCINHALLTRDAVLQRGLTLAGWVANRIDPAMEAAEDNLETLRQRLGRPLLADIPFLTSPDAGRVQIDLPET